MKLLPCAAKFFTGITESHTKGKYFQVRENVSSVREQKHLQTPPATSQSGFRVFRLLWMKTALLPSLHTQFKIWACVMYRSYHFVPPAATHTYSTAWQHPQWSDPCTPCTCCEFHCGSHSATKCQSSLLAGGTSHTPGIRQENKRS